MTGRTKAWWAAAAIYVLALTAASLMPSGREAGALAGWDDRITSGLQNALHVPAYGLLVVLLHRAAARRFGASWASVGVAAGVSLLIGLGLEVAQGMIPGRLATVSDILHNAAGCVAAALVLRLIAAVHPDRQSGPGRVAGRSKKGIA